MHSGLVGNDWIAVSLSLALFVSQKRMLFLRFYFPLKAKKKNYFHEVQYSWPKSDSSQLLDIVNLLRYIVFKENFYCSERLTFFLTLLDILVSEENLIPSHCQQNSKPLMFFWPQVMKHSFVTRKLSVVVFSLTQCPFFGRVQLQKKCTDMY